ncbi:MAG: FGGY-family carbohydrate kinase [Pseudomonadota bacterium]
MTSDLSLGIDLGTSGVRSAVVDPSGAVVAMARGRYGDGTDAWRDPEGWWRGAATCLEAQAGALQAKGRTMAEVARIAIDGTSGSLVLTDADLQPVTRALMYSDAGFTKEAALIATHAPDPHTARGAGSALARALRLLREDTGAKARHLLHQADFVAARLMGRGGFTDVNNALKTGCDPEVQTWPDWMAALVPKALLGQVYLPGDAIDQVTPQMARRFGLSDGAVVHAGTTDSIAAFLAAAPATSGAAVTSLGTTLAVKLYTHQRIEVPAQGLYSHRVRDGWLVGGASNTGGGVIRSVFPDDQIAALSAEIDPTVESTLDYYPLPKPGERFPINDPDLRPRMAPRPNDNVAFLHGLLEGIARIEKRAYEALANAGAPYPTQVITAGGGAKNVVWTAMRARVLGVPVVAAPTTEAAVGVARLAHQG